MNLGFSIKEYGNEIKLDFGRKVKSKKRYLSELLKDKVILDLENAKKFLEKRGDVLIYEVYNLWKFNETAKNFLENFGLMTDLTLLKQGVFSLKEGEAFCTYGHAHRKNLGEVYQVLKNDCFLLLTHKKNFNSYLIKIKEGYSFLIHPSFVHRLISGKKDSVILNFVPEDAGHDYDVVKNRGFPFHVFYDKTKKLYFRENEKYPKVGLVLVEKIEKLDVLKLAQKDPEKLRNMLRRPKDIYAITKNYL